MVTVAVGTVVTVGTAAKTAAMAVMVGSGGGGGGGSGHRPDDGDKSSNSALPYLEFSMTVDLPGGKVSAAATVPEVSELHGNEEAGHWRLLVYPRSHRGDEQWCSAYLAAG